MSGGRDNVEGEGFDLSADGCGEVDEESWTGIGKGGGGEGGYDEGGGGEKFESGGWADGDGRRGGENGDGTSGGRPPSRGVELFGEAEESEDVEERR